MTKLSKVKRVYVEKKAPYAVKAKELYDEIVDYLGICTVTKVRVLVRYDVENLSEETYRQALTCVFSEPPVDHCYEEDFPREDADRVFTVEYLPGQFDQRADSAMQCVRFLNEEEQPLIRTATTYVLSGEITEEQFAAVKSFCINPVDSREAAAEKPETLVMNYPEPEDVKTFDGFISMPEEDFKALYESLNLAMTYRDFKHIRHYFAGEEHRDPTVTEIRMLDTYWSDHCRHTTFLTELKNVTFEEGYCNGPIKETFERYKENHKLLYGDREDKYISLMDLATIAMKMLKKEGRLTDQEETDEINACSIVVPVEIDGETEEWLVNFKNETHNHPTEIEPFGGAATCLGGAIRDPLSGRTYVYQAMRVTGAADPTRPVEETLKGKLPQKKLVRSAADGYSSYGNQIGLATGLVKEIYHPNYVAKRMEIGAVMGAAPRKDVKRLTSDPGDVIILLGGETGRDGIGGATGSSKVHTTASIETCGAEVQKGNAPTERKLQRLFRRPEVSRLIKKCNDFGAGGVSVAIGELADGLYIDLDKVPKKYAGLDGTEIAISESQERMAVVVDPKDEAEFMKYAAEENLEATNVAVVTEDPRLVMTWRGQEIVNISRAFLNTNGAHQETDAYVEMPDPNKNYFSDRVIPDVKKEWLDTLADLNVCCQKGLVEKFDGSIGAGSVFMPHGGKYQLTETQAMVAKLPVLKGDCDTVTMMSYGFDPYLSSWSPYHGSIYAALESVSKIVATGGDFRKVHFTFQEYFRRMTDDPKRWSEPIASLLGALTVQGILGLASIGGKDSMSGTFNEIDVPPTLVSFAVDVAKEGDIITPEFKRPGSYIVQFAIEKDTCDLPDYAQVMTMYDTVHELIQKGDIISAYTLDGKGLAAAVSKMAFGNKLGVHMADSLSKHELFFPANGDIIAEVPEDKIDELRDYADEKGTSCAMVGLVTDEQVFTFRDTVITMDEAIETWMGTLDKVFPNTSTDDKTPVDIPVYKAKNIYVCEHKVAKPTVFIPVFPGTNCEYDTAKAFEQAGANVVTKVFRNLSAADIRDSVDEFSAAISQAQIIMFPGGFSAGDEPDGSAKFFATAFRDAKIADAVHDLLDRRDGLALGICNGFQAMIKLGLVPNGRITGQDENSPTLTFNTINRHVSKMVYTKVVSNKSPWLMGAELGKTYVTPASHGEGRFVANDAWLKKLVENGQVATQYADADGNVSMDEIWNVNGSYLSIEGLTSPDGRCFGKMAHVERMGRSVAKNIYGDQDLHIFESGVKYFL